MALFEGREARWARRVMIGAPYLWLALFFLLPFLIVLKLSLSYPELAQPPYAPTFLNRDGSFPSWSEIQAFFGELSLDNFEFILLDDPLYLASYLSSLRIAFVSTVLTLLIGYPLAYAIARAPLRWRGLLVLLIILPFWTSFLIRVYAWIGILKPEGFLNAALMGLGLIGEPLQIYNTDWAVYIGITYSYLPFMTLPIFATLAKLDNDLREAATDLGAKPATVFWRIILPLSLPGVAAGCFLVFIPAVGEFVIPALLGGPDTLMIGKTVYVEFFNNRDWPVASAVAVLLLLLLVGPILAFQSWAGRRGVSLG